MILAFNSAVLFNPNLFLTPQIYGIMLASMIVLGIGAWDDAREVFWKTQLFYQVAIAIIIFIFGVKIFYIANPLGGVISFNSGIGILISIALVIIWIIMMINAMNWLDGIDGLAGGISLVGAISIFSLSLYPEVNQPPVAILALALAGAVVGFLMFNFNPSMILAGTAGSMFMGFSLASLSIFAGAKVATAILVMSLPIIDFLWVIGERIKDGRSIFKPDKNHLHHKLLALGWSQRKIALYFYAITIVIAGIALNTRAIGKSITLTVVAIIMVVILIYVNKKLIKN